MFGKDVKRIIACIEHEDFYSAMEYAQLVKDNYTNKQKKYYEDIIKTVKCEGIIKLKIT